ncbi:MAG: L,D-transpeptidase/peptidoglycan binding protein [Bacillota bacterium]|nr:L,D-transpeptidase/peptidoglycan binding protein [Bacillota bacterium]
MEIINRRSKVAAGITISLCTLLAVYLGTSIYFVKHLYFGSKINGTDVSGKTVEEIKSQMTSELQAYTLNIKEADGKIEQIKAGDIDLKYKSDDQFKTFKAEQKPLKWASSLFDEKTSKMTAELTYDKEKLKQQVDKLACLNSSNVIEPKNPSFQYGDKIFEIAPETKGNKINKDVLVERVADAISKKESTLDLDSANCYANSKYTSKSQKVIEAKNTLNKYVSSKITYTFGSSKETLDGSTINKWLSVDDNFYVILDQGKVKAYIQSLANTYNTAGKTRSFHTSSGSTINVSGGDYGWQIDVDKETKALSEAIKDGQTVTKEPAYSQTTASRDTNDIGNTYVEVDMSRQHLWFYKNGSLVVEGDVVTGNVSENHATPSGVYRLKYKEKNAVLKGQDYAAPVSFWMPFNGGIGIHDASWRSEFGGQIYRSNGSHGCVNSPYNLAQTIYNNIDTGTPVVCFY